MEVTMATMHATHENMLKLIIKHSGIPKDLIVFHQFKNTREDDHKYIWFNFGLNFNKHKLFTNDLLAGFPRQLRRILTQQEFLILECDWYWDDTRKHYEFNKFRNEYIKITIGNCQSDTDCNCIHCNEFLLSKM